MTSIEARMVSVPVGVVVIREESQHPWQDHAWRPYGVIVGAPENVAWKELRRGPDWVQFHAATLPLELHRKETLAYIENLATERPSIYVVLNTHEDPDAAGPFEVHLVTASPYEAQDYQDSGEEIVEPIDMPDQIKGWVSAFIETHHEEEKFVKRQRDKLNVEEHKFGQEPIFELRRRMRIEPDD